MAGKRRLASQTSLCAHGWLVSAEINVSTHEWTMDVDRGITAA